MLASPETLPDLLHTPSKEIVNNYALSGAFVALDDVQQDMPHYTAFWDTVPDEERKVLFAERLAGDGKIYSGPVYGMDMDNMQIWMYRKDILDQHGLTPPATLDELYQVCKKLKALYPNSYPLCLRSGLNTMALIGPAWTPYFNPFVYYDYDKKEWKYGALEPAMREIVDYLIKMEDEGLVPPDFMTITTKGWEELVSTDRGFFMPDYLVRVDFFTPTARQQNPNFTLEIMAPPKAASASGQNKLARTAADATGYVLCNTGDQGRIKNAVKLLDWMYSDEAAELLSWGKEGETYELKNGRRQFLIQGDENPRNKYGVLTLGLYERVDPLVNTASMSDEQSAMAEKGAQYLEERRNPKFWMAFSDEEMKRREAVRPEIEAYTEEMLSKFILKMEPMSHWDTFLEHLAPNECGGAVRRPPLRRPYVRVAEVE